MVLSIDDGKVEFNFNKDGLRNQEIRKEYH